MHQLTQHVHCSALPVGNRCTLCPKVNRNCPFSHFSLGCSEQMYERAATGIAAEWYVVLCATFLLDYFSLESTDVPTFDDKVPIWVWA